MSLALFNFPESDVLNHPIQVLGNPDFPWFCGKDVAIALGYKDHLHALRDHVDEEDKSRLKDVFQEGRGDSPSPPIDELEKIFINESGLYSLVLRSKLEQAKKFKRWVTSEVLPSIRKKGSFSLEEKQKLLEENKSLEEDKQALEHENKTLEEEKIRLIKNQNLYLKRRQYHKLKQGPCFYIWHSELTPTMHKVGWTKDINERLRVERGCVSRLHLDYLVYLHNARLLESILLEKYREYLVEPNHEIMDVLLDKIIKSCKAMLKWMDYEYTEEDELWRYNNEEPPQDEIIEEDDEQPTKKCNRCLDIKPVTCYAVNGRSLSGDPIYRCRCKSCEAELARERRSR